MTTNNHLPHNGWIQERHGPAWEPDALAKLQSLFQQLEAADRQWQTERNEICSQIHDLRLAQGGYWPPDEQQPVAG
jgi:hypothetical protein